MLNKVGLMNVLLPEVVEVSLHVFALLTGAHICKCGFLPGRTYPESRPMGHSYDVQGLLQSYVMVNRDTGWSSRKESREIQVVFLYIILPMEALENNIFWDIVPNWLAPPP